MCASITSFARLLAACLGVLALGLVTGRAQTTVSPNHVTFYTEPNFRGEALTVEAGANVVDLSQMTRPSNKPWVFAISSVKVEGDARATVYSSPGMRGDRLEITRSISDLYGETRGTAGTWDRAIASVTVSGTQSYTAPATAPPVRYEHEPSHPTVVVVPRTVAPPPPPVRQVRRVYDIRTVDAVIQRAYRDVLGRSADPDGIVHYRRKLVYEGWTEAQMIHDLQRSREARSVSADEAITRAYREVLGRDPDPQGLNHYRARWRDGWTQGQIRDDLRRSVEGRTGSIHNAITRAYREILGRDPDPAGYATYERLMRERGMSERELRATLMNGDEYRQKQSQGRGRGR